MNLYKSNLQLISDSYSSRIGFYDEKLFIDNRFFIGIRSLYSISKIKEILDKSFRNFINMYDLILYLNKSNRLDNIKNNLIKEYEDLIEGVIYGLLYMSSKNTYYFENEQEIFFDLYTKYCKIYHKLNNRFKSAILDIKTPSSSDSESISDIEHTTIDNINKPQIDNNIILSISDKFTKDIINESVNKLVEIKNKEKLNKEFENIFEKKNKNEFSEQEPNARIVNNPAFSVVYINENVINNSYINNSEEVTVYDRNEIPQYIKHPENSNTSQQNKRSCKIFKKISQLLSGIKKIIHNAYKGVVSFLFN